jgi:hypothetical protein
MERLLRVLLKPADRDTITGDLLEEYREAVLPARGQVRARLWYGRQVVSFLAQAPALWLVLGCALAIVEGLHVNAGPPWSLAHVWLVLVLGCALNAVHSARSANVSLLIRDSAVFGLVFGAAMMLAVVFAVLAPLEDGHTVLQAYDAGRRQILVGAGAAILLAAGWYGARRGDRVGTGTLTATTTVVMGFVVTVALVTMVVTLAPSLRGQLGPIGTLAWNPRRPLGVPVDNLLMLLILSILPGTIGGAFGRGLVGWTRQRDVPRTAR